MPWITHTRRVCSATPRRSDGVGISVAAPISTICPRRPARERRPDLTLRLSLRFLVRCRRKQRKTDAEPQQHRPGRCRRRDSNCALATSNGAIGAGDTRLPHSQRSAQGGTLDEPQAEVQIPVESCSATIFSSPRPIRPTRLRRATTRTSGRLLRQVTIGRPCNAGRNAPSPVEHQIGKRSTARCFSIIRNFTARESSVSVSSHPQSDPGWKCCLFFHGQIRVKLLAGRSGRYRVSFAVPRVPSGSQFVIARFDASAIPGIGRGPSHPAGAASIFS